MERKTVAAVVGVVLIAVLVTAAIVYYSLRLRGHGIIKTVGIEAYADAECTKICSEVDWGYIGPGESKAVALYLKNTGNVPVNLTLTTENWVPAAAAGYLTLSWDHNGTFVGAGAVRQVTITLSVATDITGIVEFAFDIVITAAG